MLKGINGGRRSDGAEKRRKTDQKKWTFPSVGLILNTETSE